MNAQRIELPAVGLPLEGGYYAGRINISGTEYAILVAPKADGDIKGKWHTKYSDVEGTHSYFDGLANTKAMAAAGSALAKKVLVLSIGGFADWYIPAQDELELCYRAFKPSTDDNSTWMRSGINLSAVPPTRPYDVDGPSQTAEEAFRKNGAEAFESDWYWTSTQHASSSDYAWGQGFRDGSQSSLSKDDSYRVRAVRRIAI